MDGLMCNLRILMQPVTSVSSEINVSSAKELDLIGIYLPLPHLLWKWHQIYEVTIDWNCSVQKSLLAGWGKSRQDRKPPFWLIFLLWLLPLSRGDFKQELLYLCLSSIQVICSHSMWYSQSFAKQSGFTPGFH